MEKKLVIKKPIVTTYTHHAYSFIALSNVNNAYKWIYSNYIQMYLNKDFTKNAWGDFYFPMPYEVKCYELCPYLRVEKNDFTYIIEKYNSPIEYIIESINRGFYIHILMDYFYVSQSPFFGKRKRKHDCLIYGYDEELKELYCGDFMFSDIRSFSFGVIKFDEFEKGIKSVTNDTDHILNNYIYKMKPFESERYEFNINNIIHGLRAYLKCTPPEYWLGYNFGNGQDIAWGLNCYNVFVDNLKKEPERMDLRFVYMFMDHKKIMIERLLFLKNELGIKGLESVIEEYNAIYEELYKVLNLLIKYTLCNRDEVINQALEIIMGVRKKEDKSLKSMISILESE